MGNICDYKFSIIFIGWTFIHQGLIAIVHQYLVIFCFATFTLSANLRFVYLSFASLSFSLWTKPMWFKCCVFFPTTFALPSNARLDLRTSDIVYIFNTVLLKYKFVSQVSNVSAANLMPVTTCFKYPHQVWLECRELKCLQLAHQLDVTRYCFPATYRSFNCIVLHNYFPWYIHHPPHDTNAPTQGHRHVHWQAQTDTQNNIDFTPHNHPLSTCYSPHPTMVERWLHTQHFKVLLLVVMYDQQHPQQQHLYIYDVVVGGHLRPTTPTTTTFRYLWCC